MIERWVAFWDRREAPTTLALVRILVAAALLGDLLIPWRLDLVPDLWVAPPFGLGYGAAARKLPWSLELFGNTPEAAGTLWLVTTLSALLLLTGTLTRLSALALALFYAQLSQISPSADRGIDDLLRIACLLLAFSGAGALWSFDALQRKLRGLPRITQVPAWPRYLLFLQVLWVYFSAATHRNDEDWWLRGGYSALGKILADPHFARFTPGTAGSIYPLTQLGTLATMLFEFTAPLMLLWTWYERTPRWPGKLRYFAVLLRVRWIWLALGALFHVGIALSMRLGMFPYGMLALYPVFLSPGEIEEALAWLRRQRERSRSTLD